MQYMIKLRANPDNPAYECVYPNELEDESNSESDTDKEFHDTGRNNSIPNFHQRNQEFMAEAGIAIETIDLDKVPSIEPWLISEPIINLELTEYTKTETTPELYKARFREVREQYQGHSEIYTD